MSLTGWAIRNIRPIMFLTTVLCIVGVAAYFVFPVSILPDVTFPRVVIVADSGDRPTRMMEVSITRPLEEALATIPDVKRIRSKTEKGSTEISVDFLDGTDIVVAEQLVNARVNQSLPELPADTKTEVERMNATVFPVLGLNINSKSLTQTELWNLATYTIKPRLSRVPGVARVVVQGGRPPEIAVAIRPGDLATFGVSTAQVVTALQESNVIHSVGRLDREFKQYHIVVTGETKELDDIRGIAVAQHGGNPIRLDQIADVSYSTEDRTTVVSANGSESVLINMIRQPTANSVAMVDAVQQEIEAMRSSLPSDVQVGTFYDQSVLIRDAVNGVRDAVLIGAILSVFVLMLFLRDVRATLITAAIIPATLLITFILMRLAGLSLNLMTLGALAVGIGLVVDDAIVVVECVFRALGQTSNVAEAVGVAAKQIMAPMVSSTLTTVVVFLPLALLQGVAGAFFISLALTLTMALMVSLLLALCVSPSLCAAFLRYRDDLAHEGRFLESINARYERLLQSLLRQKWVILPIIVGCLAGTWFLSGRLQTGFMPAIDEGAFVLDYWTPPGTSLAESDRLLRKIDAILKDTPEIRTFSRRTGTELGFAITEPNRGDYAVMLKENRKRHIDDVIADIRDRVKEEMPDLDVEFIQVLQDLIGDLAGNPTPVEVKIFGEDKQEAEGLAEELAGKLEKVHGLADVSSGVIEAGPEFEFRIDPGQAGRLGVTVADVAAQAEASILGTVATQVLAGDRQIPVRVRLTADRRLSLEEIERVGIQTPSGRVLLKDIAEIKEVPGSTQSEREDQRRLVSVTSELDGVDLGTAVGGVTAKMREMSLPPGVTMKLAGQYQNQQESFKNLAEVLGASVLLVFTVMVFQFRTFRPPIVVLILMPLSLFGAVLALWATGTALNVSSFMGVIMLAGIVVKNGILLLDRAQHSIEAGQSANEAVLEAGRARLRPILMTTLTAILGLVPLALGIGAGAEMQKPLAVAVIGGLLFSTILTLLIGPVLYAMMLRSPK